MWKSVALLLLWTLVSSIHSQSTEKSLPIINNSGGNVALYWINPNTREPQFLSELSSIEDGREFPVNTFTGHEFELRELPTSRGICTSSPDQTCRSKYFVVTASDKQGENK
jgi:hypothetical protein